MRNLNTSDVFEFARMIKDLGLKEEIKEISVKATAALNNQSLKTQENEEAGSEQTNMLENVGMDMFLGLLEKLTEKKSESAFYKFLSGPFEIEPEAVGKLDPLELIEGLTKMADVQRWKGFLKLAIR